MVSLLIVLAVLAGGYLVGELMTWMDTTTRRLDALECQRDAERLYDASMEILHDER